MDKFLSCDWGTSSFRLRLIDAVNLDVIAEIKNDQGIAGTYRAWEQQDADILKRKRFYTNIIKEQIELLSKVVNSSLHDIPVILSGMASSTIGLIDMPYKPLPFSLDGSDLEIKFFEADADFNPLIIISGAKTDSDVMRGEETKIVGCSSVLTNIDGEQLLILPGTHPKHIVVKGGKAVSFKTYMTGEFFDLLSTKSVLSASVASEGDFEDPANRQGFSDGIKAARESNLLHASFMVRTNQVLKAIPKQQNFYYLSGLLIGTELKDLKPNIPVYLVGGATHQLLYTEACQLMGIQVSKQLDADDTLIKGQQTIFSRYYKR